MMFQFFISAAEAVLTIVSPAVTATPAATVSESKLAALSIFSKGLFTTLLGLVGVFLVLSLFYVSIKIMQRRKDQNPGGKE
jgi:hypothetical protein